MMSAISATKSGNEVVLLEKNKMLGKKLLITGKGRCNITSSLQIDEFIKNIPGNGRFLYSSFGNFTNIDIINMLKENGVEVKEERGNRIFPVSDKSIDVRDAFARELQKNKVKIKMGVEVKSILQKDGKVIGVKLANGEIEKADKVILATGGKSYPATGSTGDGYAMSKTLGHTITKIKPSLVPLTALNNEDIEIKIVEKSKYKTSLNLCKNLQGLSLRNVKIEIIDENKNKKIYEDFGEMLFTHFGVSGPTILSASSHLLRYKNIEELLKSGKIILKIDLKPALSEEKLNARILRDFETNKNKEIKNSLNELLPQKLIMPIINLLNIDENKKVNSITKEERIELVKLLKNFQIAISGFRGIEEAIITAGGISIKEIDPKTMQSKLVQGLYFAGEIIDVDAYTGGFNLQIAYSTGFTAGMD
ncbi:MAG: NAD(P)/FAD-dependent oxidoreductase [Clostridia bacterium]|nr:NAD(P)/FAD-dependent oxidoreductase [Clostridia bacterium]